MASFLKLEFPDETQRLTDLTLTSNPEWHANLPFARSSIITTKIIDYTELTKDAGNKIGTVYEMRFGSEGFDYNFEPGDTIGILPSNSTIEVEALITRLKLEQHADVPYILTVANTNSKRKFKIPKHIPISSTFRNILLYSLDIRSVPKKLFLKALQQFASDEKESETIGYICSTEGSAEYLRLISTDGRTLLTLLNKFPSCHPSLESILEHLPPLLPRPYSISSSPLIRNYFTITFNILSAANKPHQKGVCCGWLEGLTKQFEKKNTPTVRFYFRTVKSFRLPGNDNVPIIMIATGTGIAPFRGFLQHRSLQMIQSERKFAESWLFYGCRYATEDNLYKEEIQSYLESGALTKLLESFSKEVNSAYVQHNIDKHGKEFTSMVIHRNAVIYVCGNSTKMVADVRKSILVNLVLYGQFSEEDAVSFIKQLEIANRYNVDAWS